MIDDTCNPRTKMGRWNWHSRSLEAFSGAGALDPHDAGKVRRWRGITVDLLWARLAFNPMKLVEAENATFSSQAGRVD